MTQVIKLTEQDLVRVVKKLLKEQSTPPSDQYYTFNGEEYKRDQLGQWFVWSPVYAMWLSLNRDNLELQLEKMRMEKNPYLKPSNKTNAEKQEPKKSIYQTYQLPKEKKTPTEPTPKRKFVTLADVAKGDATIEDYKINYEAPAMGPDGCPFNYKTVSQEEIEMSKDKLIKPWNDTRTGPSNYKKINGKICKKIQPELPEITLGSILDAIREFLNGTAGTVATTILNLTGIGTLALEALYAILAIYDYSNKDWLNFIIDFINLLTGGTVMKGLKSLTQNIGKVSSTSQALSKLKSLPQFESILGTITDAIKKGINFITPFLTKASSILDELFSTTWVSKVAKAIIDFGEEFIKNFTQGQIKNYGAQKIYQVSTNERIKIATKKVLLEYYREKKYSFT